MGIKLKNFVTPERDAFALHLVRRVSNHGMSLILIHRDGCESCILTKGFTFLSIMHILLLTDLEDEERYKNAWRIETRVMT